MNNPQQLVGRTLDMNTHSSLMSDKALFYMMNGDIQSPEAPNADLFVTNHLSNESCYQFPTGYQYCGNVQLAGFEYLLCFKTPTSSEIGILDVSNCNYRLIVNAPCLNFDPNHPIRGKYKNKSDNNDRRVYLIDQFNRNRFIDIDQEIPKKLLSNFCDSCEKVYSTEVDCSKLQMNRNVKPPQIVINTQKGGSLNSGVYQFAIAFGEDDVPLTDYYFSPVIKLFSENSDIYLDIEIKCVGEQVFPQMFVKLVTNTRESSQVVYSIGTFNSSQSRLSISTLSNVTVFSVNQVLQKSVSYDYSEHIATNGETLLLGKHRLQEPLYYQSQANAIIMKWAEVKVKGKDAHKYPVFLRDEIYPFAIEWFDLQGKSRGMFHIPGRAPVNISLFDKDLGDFVLKSETADAPEEYWQDRDENCNLIPAKIYEVMNTAQITFSANIICSDCIGPDLRNFITKKGTMGYHQSKDYTYPSNSEWGSLACTPIRYHRIPSHDKSHTYGELSADTWEINPNECVNLMTIFPENIEHPKLPDGTYDPDISGYRILWGDRIGTGNKSILHKGFLVSGRIERNTQPNLVTDIIYPNYPFNDENPDPFLSTTQTADFGSPENFTPANINTYQDQFYYSPDIFYRETRNEIGSFITKYAEEIGSINGKIASTYLHPSIALGKGGTPINFGLKTFAFQVNSVSNFTKSYNSGGPSVFSYYDNYLINKSQYLLPIKQKVILDDMGTEVKINNLYRDYNYYFRLNRQLIKVKEDVSRVIASEIDCPPENFAPVYYTSLDTVVRNSTPKSIQSVLPFIGVKVRVPNQYGSLEDIKYIPCNQPVTIVPPSDSYAPGVEIKYSTFHLGGDVFISKHAITRRFPLFTSWLYDVPFDTETDYRERRNIERPRFWYDNLSKAEDQWNLDCERVVATSPLVIEGKFYTSVNGILSFYLESEFIGDYRETNTDPNGSFYPKSDPDDLFRSDIFKLNEKFLYNIALLNGNIESGFQNLNPTESKADYTVIVSQKDDPQAAGDKWLQFLPSNYTILPRIYGRFTGMHYTDMYSLFFMFENEILYSQINFTLNTNEGNGILLNQGDIFSNRLQKLSNEETGYCGSVDPLSFVNTRYGTFFVDRYRKKVFLWSQGLKDITGTMTSWLNKYLIDKEPTYTDSIISVYDNYTGNVYFTENIERFLKKFTLSYKPAAQGWNSFHSFIPQAYLHAPNTYLSVIDTGVWKHNSLYDYQRYYGIQYPFDVGIILSSQFTNVELQSLEIFSEWIKYLDYGQEIYVKDKFFDKVFAYNNNGSTGIIPTFLKTKANPKHSLIQNAETPSYIMEVTQVLDSVYRLNKLQSYKQDQSIPPVAMTIDGTSYTPQGISTSINPINREDIKGKWVKLHLISDTNYENKILLQLINSNISPISK